MQKYTPKDRQGLLSSFFILIFMLYGQIDCVSFSADPNYIIEGIKFNEISIFIKLTIHTNVFLWGTTWFDEDF